MTARALGTLLLTLLAGCAAPGARPSSMGPVDGEARSAFDIEPLVWLPGFVGTAALGAGSGGGGGGGGGFGTRVRVDDPFGFESGFLLHAEWRLDPRWSLFGDGLWVDYGASADGPGPLRSRLELDATVTRLALARRLVESARRGDWELDAYVGARHSGLDLAIDVQGFGRPTGSDHWVDPLVGLRGRVALGPEVELLLAGDVGGHASGSDRVWSALARAEWTVDPGSVLFAGYEVLDYDFEDGSGLGALLLDARLGGPLFGLTLRF